MGSDQNIKTEAAKADLNDYAGKYKMTGLPFPYIEVSVKDGKLVMKAREQEGAISPMSDADTFDAGGESKTFVHA